MKIITTLLFILIAFVSNAQQIDYCKYYTLRVKEVEYEGKKLKSYKPILDNVKKDKYYKFFKQHEIRFDYILLTQLEKYPEVAKYYPDTTKIKSEFCNQIINTDKVQKYFEALTPKPLSKRSIKVDTFTLNELMLVASRYFYCDNVSQKDTSIDYHICVGINGQKEIKSDKDLTLLRAFSIEAILHHFLKNKNPKFVKHLDKYIDQLELEKKKDFNDTEKYLLEIRSLCYQEMEKNEDLKSKLLKYYKENRNNLNFVILD